MGANPTQALALLLFLIGFTLISAGLFTGGNVILLALGVAGLAASVILFLKAKPLEHLEG